MIVFDFYCKAGGNARGLHSLFEQHGVEIVGVDHEPQPNYPYWFIQADALKTLRALIAGQCVVGVKSHGRKNGILHTEMRQFGLDEAIYIWASPPCLDNTVMRHAPNTKKHKDLIAPTRKLLVQTGKPWTIENVESDKARARLRNPVLLCGTMFGLRTRLSCDNGKLLPVELQRHRLFESSFSVPQPTCQHAHPAIGIYGSHARVRAASVGGRGTKWPFLTPQANAAARALGLPLGCMTLEEFGNAIPPAYAEYIAGFAPCLPPPLDSD